VSDYKIRRGPWGKPWVTTNGEPLDWGPDPDRPSDKPFNAELYFRPSDMSGYLDSAENLSPYQQAQAVFGVVTEKVPSLIWQFRALASEHKDPWKAAKGEVKDLLRQARMLGGEENKSGIGSSIHRFCHLRDIGEECVYPVSQLEEWLDCYEEAMQVFDVLMDEEFVVCDEVRTAGNFDRLLRARRDLKFKRDGQDIVIPEGTILVGDIKSGAHDANFALKPTVQTAIYGHSELYDQETGKREPLQCSLSHAVLIHVPFHAGGNPRCDIYPLDMDYGWHLAKMAAQIPAARSLKLGKRTRLSKAEVKSDGQDGRSPRGEAPAAPGHA